MAESEPISDNIVLDLDRKGEIMGIEVLGPTPIDLTKFSPPVKIVSKNVSSSSKD